MRWAGLALVLALAACGDSQSSPPADAPADAMAGGPCDAAPVVLCVDDQCTDGYCVAYHTESGFPSCNDYDACVATALTCTPGVCDPDCEAALCPAPYTCDATATGRFGCVEP